VTASGPGTGSEPPEPPDPFEPFEAPERSVAIRGVAIVGIVIVIGALLLPSATRAPLTVLTSGSATTTTISGSATTTTSPSHSTSTTAAAPAPATIHVLVANATSVNGVAGAVTSFLEGKDFGTLTAANSLVKLTATEVFPVSAAEVPAAAEVASVLGLPQASIQAAGAKPPVASSGSASVVVIAGADLAARFATTTTTARG